MEEEQNAKWNMKQAECSEMMPQWVLATTDEQLGNRISAY